MCLTEYKCKCDVNADFYSASYAPSMPMSVHTGKFLPVRRYARAVAMSAFVCPSGTSRCSIETDKRIEL